MRKIIFLLSILILLSTTMVSAEQCYYKRIESPNGFAYGVSGWVKTDTTSSSKDFTFAWIEVTNEKYHSEVVNCIKQLVNWNCYVEYDDFYSNKSGVAYIWIKEPKDDITEEFVRNNLVNAILVEKGYARVIRGQTPSKYETYLLKFQEEAQKNHIGMWQ